MLRCLLSGVCSPATSGTVQMLRENPDGREVFVCGADANPHLFSQGIVDLFQTVPPSGDPAYVPSLLALCEREEIDLLLFQSDHDILTCARARPQFERIGTQLLCADIEVLETVTNKAKLYQALEGEVAIPDYRLVTKESVEESAYAMGYPERDLVIKPLAAWGAHGVYHLTEKPLPWDQRLRIPMVTLAHVQKSLDRSCLLVEALPGIEYSVDACGSVAIPRRRDQIVGGVATQTTLVHYPEIADFTLRAGAKLGLPYLYGMQFRCDEGGNPKLLECNPRIQGTLIASLYSGVNLLWMAIRQRLGLAVRPSLTPTHGTTFTRNWDGRISNQS